MLSAVETRSADRRDVWLVVPAYNEAQRLDATLRALCAAWPSIVVIDDGSTDETARVALRHPVWLLSHLVNCGQGAALRTGVAFALAQAAEVVVTFDADGQHDPADIPRLVDALREGADVALGSRFLGSAPGMPRARRWLLAAAVLFTRLTTGVRVTDAHNGLRALSRRAAAQIRLVHSGMAHASEFVSEVRAHGLAVREVPVTVRYSAETLAKGQRSRSALHVLLQLFTGWLIR